MTGKVKQYLERKRAFAAIIAALVGFWAHGGVVSLSVRLVDSRGGDDAARGRHGSVLVVIVVVIVVVVVVGNVLEARLRGTSAEQLRSTSHSRIASATIGRSGSLILFDFHYLIFGAEFLSAQWGKVEGISG